MTILRTVPIFCDTCSCLALAELDGAPLCTDCLLSAVRDRNPEETTATIAPLTLEPAVRPRTLGKQLVCVLPRRIELPETA